MNAEERNVLDQLLDNGDDEDFDAELTKNEHGHSRRTSRKTESKRTSGRRQKTGGATTSRSSDNNHHRVEAKHYKTSTVINKSRSVTPPAAGNGNSSTHRRRQRSESPCGSQYSCDSGSCSCENYSSAAEEDEPAHEPDRSPAGAAADGGGGSPHSYHSVTESPGFKIRITKDSDTREIKTSGSHASRSRRKRKRERTGVEDDDRVLSRRRRAVDEDSSSKRIRRPTMPMSESKIDYASLIKYFFKDSCYFLMKSNNQENVEISKREGVWSTPMVNELKLDSAFCEFRNVILIFSVKESGKFQGFARLSSPAQYDLEPVPWVLPPGVTGCPFGGIFFVDWICRNELPFTRTSHLYNAFNEGKPVKIARDGQEIEPKVGEELCRLFPADEYVDLIPLLKRMKKQAMGRLRKRHSRGPFLEYDRPQFDGGPGREHINYRTGIVKPSLPPPAIPMTLKRPPYPPSPSSSPLMHHVGRISSRDEGYHRMTVPSRRSMSDHHHSVNGYGTGPPPPLATTVCHYRLSDSYGDRRYYSSGGGGGSFSNSHHNHHHHYSSSGGRLSLNASGFTTSSSSRSSMAAVTGNSNHHHHDGGRRYHRY